MDKNELVPALKDTIFNDSIKEVSLDICEAAIDSIGDSDVFSEVPILKTIIAIRNTGNKIYERHMMRETIRFIQGFNSNRLDEDIISNYKIKLENDEKRLNEELNRVLLYLNFHTESNQSNRLGKIYFYYITGKIDWDRFSELSEVNKRLFDIDVPILLEINNNSNCDYNYQADRLASLGLVRMKVGSLEDDKLELDATRFHITELGKLLLQIID